MTESELISSLTSLLKESKNLILTGAPGTGKTYLAKAIAEAMKAEYDFVQFHPSYDYTDFVEGLRPTSPDSNGNIGFKRMDGAFKSFCSRALDFSVPSVPSYSEALSQFKEELKKKGSIVIKSCKSNTKIKFELNANGSISVPDKSDWCVSDEKMLKFLITGEVHENDTYTRTIGKYIIDNYISLNNGLTEPKNHSAFVFIIDEINRGEISKIFGELFYAIDPGYRGIAGRVKTQYQNLITDSNDPFFEGFYIPENVYIIGTMNDIDRSVESMDFAMRRRFAWKEIKPNDNTGMLGILGELKEDVITIMTGLNSAIWDEINNQGIEGLNSAYHIGGAYYSKLGNYLDSSHSNIKEAYGHLWNNHLKGLLTEYLRGSYDASENLKKLEDKYNELVENSCIKG